MPFLNPAILGRIIDVARNYAKEEHERLSKLDEEGREIRPNISAKERPKTEG